MNFEIDFAKLIRIQLHSDTCQIVDKRPWIKSNEEFNVR